MKLILATNQTSRFVDFYDELQRRSGDAFTYSSYQSLLFSFDTSADQAISVVNTASGGPLSDYEGVYINGYLQDYELAVTVAICCDYLGIPFVNAEMRAAPSLSKLSAYAKLAATGVPIPRTFAGTKTAILAGIDRYDARLFPAILKRADADRGIDNFKVADMVQAVELLQPYDDSSLWILQDYVENDGFYLVSYYGQQPKFCIFRDLAARPDANPLKAHMYKPKGGSNARLLELANVPEAVMMACLQAMQALNRQVGSVDCLYNPATGQARVLEVNYNPQLVTIETFADIRQHALIDFMQTEW